jgi:capsular polysaccharide transport system permease protein
LGVRGLLAYVPAWKALDGVAGAKTQQGRGFVFHGYAFSFILLVVIPSILAVVYLAFFAADQFAAEAKFAVRASQAENSDAKMSTHIPSLAGQDAYIVTNYIHSRAIVDDLLKTVDLRAIFTRPEADFYARLKPNPSIEDLVNYWNGMVVTYVDGPSGIVTVAVRAFRKDDALLLSNAVISASERLVNTVSARARNDAVRASEEEVRRYEKQVRNALFALRTFRDSEGFIDPASQATSTSTLLLQEMGEKIKLQSELFVSERAMSADAPTVRNLRTRLDSIEKQIERLKSQLTGNSPASKTISSSLVKFEELELQRVFSEKLYTMAQDAFERARVRAEQQNIYVSVFVPPSLPQSSEYPERLALSFIIPIALLVIWGILALVAAAIEDHRL